MITVISQESLRRLKDSSHEGVTRHEKTIGRRTSSILRMLAWYRQAVTKPVSDEERVEWREIGF